MALDKAIASGKEHRKPYRKPLDCATKTCQACLKSALHGSKKREQAAKDRRDAQRSGKN